LLIGSSVIGCKVDKKCVGVLSLWIRLENQKIRKMLALIGLKTGFAKLFRVIESHGGIL
jgi:hypothetical protein